MASSFVPIDDDASFSVEGSNYSLVANFSSDQSNVFVRTYVNSNSNIGYIWGVSNTTQAGARFLLGKIQTNSTTPSNDFSINNGNVGIGVTVSANYKLDVAGDINYTGSLYNRGALLNISASNNWIGIGTSTPSTLLDVKGNAAFSSIFTSNLTIRTVSTNNTPSLSVTQQTGAFNAVVADFYDYDWSSNVPIMRIGDTTQQGYVGINTTSASYALDVYGDIRTTGSLRCTAPTGTSPLLVTSTTTVTNLSAQYVSGRDLNYLTNASNLSMGVLPLERLPLSGITSNVYGNSNTSPLLEVDQYGRVRSIGSTQIRIPSSQVTGLSAVATSGDYNSLSNISFVLNGTSATYMNGNVGIGVNSPERLLHVGSSGGDCIARISGPPSSVNIGVELIKNSATLAGMRMVYAAADNRMYIDRFNNYVTNTLVTIDNASGNVGIGTTNPTVPLHVIGSLRATLTADDLTTGTLDPLRLQTVSGLTAATYGNASNVSIITTDTKGRVIGASNIPITIVKSAITDIVDPWTKTVSDIYYTSGNVGVGTATVKEKLQVQGNALVAGNIYPTACNVYDLGTTTNNFRTLYVATSLNINGATITTASNIMRFTAPPGSPATLANAFVNDINVSGNANVTGNISAANLKASAFTDTTVASNITIGTLNASVFPATGVTSNIYGSASAVPRFVVDSTGRLVTAANLNIQIASSAVTGLATSATTDTTNAANITTGTLPLTVLPTANVTSTGTFGSANTSPQLTVDTYGRVTKVSSCNIAITASAVSGLAAVATSGDYNSLSNRTFILNGTNAYFTNGNVGIGTITPSNALTVGTGATDATSSIMLNGTDCDKIILTYVQNGSRISHAANWNINHYAGQGSSTNGGFRFFLGSGVANVYNERVTFAYNGNVGIGSTVPAFALDVATGTGDINYNGTLYYNKTTPVISAGVVNASVLPTTTVTANSYGSANSVATFTVDNKGRLTAAASIAINNVPSTSIVGLCNVATTGDYNSLSNKTFVLSGTSATFTSGNVGIGTTLAQAALNVQTSPNIEQVRIGTNTYSGISISSSASNASGATDYVYIGCKPSYSGGAAGGTFEPSITFVNTFPRNYADVALVTTGGSVGIGTTNTNAKLHVVGDINVTSSIKQNGTEIVSASGVISATALPTTTVTANSYGSANSVATFTVDNKGRLTAASSVSIANVPSTSIVGLCNVATSGDYNSLINKTFTLSGSNAVYANGNVGIGFNNPAYKLAVAGSIYCDATMFASNITVLGEYTTLNTITSNTEQMYITNAGSGPAIYVKQTGPQPVAYFYDDVNVALAVADGGNVGIGTTLPAYSLEVVGSLNVKGSIFQYGSNMLVSANNINGGTLSASVLPASGVTSNAYGSATTVPRFVVDSTGRLSFASNVNIAISSTAVSGLATSATTDTTNAANITSGKLLASVFPTTGVTSNIYGSASTVPQFVVDATGRLASASSVNIAISSAAVSGLATSATTDTTNAANITTGKLLASVFPTTGVTSNIYGSASAVPQFVVDGTGRLVSAANVTISIPSSSVTGLAASATTNTTNATNITTGTLSASLLPSSGVTSNAYGSASSVPRFIVDGTGRLTFASNVNVQIASSAVTGLAASATTDATNASNITTGTLGVGLFPVSGATAGTYGTSNIVPRITVDIYGRVTSISTSTALSTVAVSGNYNDLTNKTFQLNGTNAYYIAGNVGIGTSTPTAPMEVVGTVKATTFIGDGSQLTGVTSASVVSSQWNNSNAGSSSNIYYNTGYVGIGTANPQYLLHVNGNVYATNVLTYSDATLKTEVATITNALETINNIRGVTYKLPSEAKRYMGVIAQEVERVAPEVVNTDHAGSKSVSYGNMVGLLIEAVKDVSKIMRIQQEEIKALRAEIDALKLAPPPM